LAGFYVGGIDGWLDWMCYFERPVCTVVRFHAAVQLTAWRWCSWIWGTVYLC
jgi:hypothetical protein